jgi:lipopolysaccharide transport system permease protein
MIAFLLRPWRLILANHNLLTASVSHTIVSRYRGSWIGLLWPFLLPLLMITVFSLVFIYVMPLKWIATADAEISFPLFLFSGMVVFTLFAEVINQSPQLVMMNTNLVKKVVFPLEMLSVSNAVTAMVFFLANLVVLMLFVWYQVGHVSIRILLYLPFVIPFMLFLIGMSWFLSSLSVYLRDLVHVVGVVVSALMFLSPVFYPLESAAEFVRTIQFLNPIAILIESLRAFLFETRYELLKAFVLMNIYGLGVFYLGFYWFQRLKGGFADVL